jgi:clan AA aspartic protease
VIIGTINPFREAVLLLKVRGPGGLEGEVEAVIDTGFTDYLTLPPALTAHLGLRLDGAMLVTLADGSTVRVAVYTATVVWDNRLRTVPVIQVDGGSLVGMSLLYGSAVRLEVVDGRQVTIEALP